MSKKSIGFDFKQFHINHDQCTMKVGTDAVLLGAWTSIANACRILDIGTGSGIIALMLAQRTSHETTINAIEPDHDSAQQAVKNVIHSPWAKKVVISETSLQNFHSPHQFDLIITNPPFFLNSQLPPSAKRSKARHTHSLSYQELIHATKQLLTPQGRLSIVLPTVEGLHFQELARAENLYVIRQLSFFSRQGKSQERWLFEFSFTQQQIEKETLILHETGEAWSESYQQITREFYTKL